MLAQQRTQKKKKRKHVTGAQNNWFWSAVSATLLHYWRACNFKTSGSCQTKSCHESAEINKVFLWITRKKKKSVSFTNANARAGTHTYAQKKMCKTNVCACYYHKILVKRPWKALEWEGCGSEKKKKLTIIAIRCPYSGLPPSVTMSSLRYLWMHLSNSS